MFDGILVAIMFTLFSAALLIVKKRRKTSSPGGREERLARLEEVLRSAQLTNDSFFQSLELVQKNLESLIARAESAEQRLRALMLRSGPDKKDQYAAAALLLGEGQQPERVAAMLSLPLPQVQIVSELQKVAGKEKKSATQRKRDDTAPELEAESQSKIAAGREKTAAQPVRLVDMIRKAAAEAARSNADARAFRGINV